MTESLIKPVPRTIAVRPLVAALRVRQWVKNLLVFMPLVLAHKVFDTRLLAQAAIAFAAFCLAASSAYILNDLLDREADRQHHEKRTRPFAAGEISPGIGILLAVLLFAGALVLALLLEDRFQGLLLLYVTLTTAYSAYLKRVAVLDVLLLAWLYTLRVLAGSAATRVHLSTWLLAFSMFLFLSLAFLKRYGEVSALGGSAETALTRRGYLREDREWLGSMGGASGYLAVLVLALYLNSEQVVALYRTPTVLWLICPLLLFWISRMWLMAHRGRLHEDPIVATARDPISYLVGGLIGVVVVAAL